MASPLNKIIVSALRRQDDVKGELISRCWPVDRTQYFHSSFATHIFILLWEKEETHSLLNVIEDLPHSLPASLSDLSSCNKDIAITTSLLCDVMRNVSLLPLNAGVTRQVDGLAKTSGCGQITARSNNDRALYRPSPWWEQRESSQPDIWEKEHPLVHEMSARDTSPPRGKNSPMSTNDTIVTLLNWRGLGQGIRWLGSGKTAIDEGNRLWYSKEEAQHEYTLDFLARREDGIVTWFPAG